MPTNVDRYWRQFLASLPEEERQSATMSSSFYFGSKPENAPQITPLVLSGQKTATGSLKWDYDAAGTAVPQPGELSVITNGGDDPVCVIRTTDVQIIPFDEVSEDWAFHGGEGDRTLASWRDMYWTNIVAECARLRREPQPSVPLAMERFEVIYDEPISPVLAD